MAGVLAALLGPLYGRTMDAAESVDAAADATRDAARMVEGAALMVGMCAAYALGRQLARDLASVLP